MHKIVVNLKKKLRTSWKQASQGQAFIIKGLCHYWQLALKRQLGYIWHPTSVPAPNDKDLPLI